VDDVVELLEAVEVVAESGVGRAWMDVRRRKRMGVKSVSCILTFEVCVIELINIIPCWLGYSEEIC
jgi:hypothetical protein